MDQSGLLLSSELISNGCLSWLLHVAISQLISGPNFGTRSDRVVYLLETEKDAERTATGQMLRTDARRASKRFVVHSSKVSNI